MKFVAFTVGSETWLHNVRTEEQILLEEGTILEISKITGPWDKGVQFDDSLVKE